MSFWYKSGTFFFFFLLQNKKIKDRNLINDEETCLPSS